MERVRAIFLDRIKQAYERNPNLANLLVDSEFAKEIIDHQSAWRRVVCLAINSGISTPGMSVSLAYFDTILLASNYDDAICYVETMNLDGETNLKLKQAPEATSKLQEDSNFQNFRAVIKCEDPNAGVAYGRGVTEVERALSRRHESHPGQELKKISESKSSIKGFNFMDER